MSIVGGQFLPPKNKAPYVTQNTEASSALAEYEFASAPFQRGNAPLLDFLAFTLHPESSSVDINIFYYLSDDTVYGTHDLTHSGWDTSVSFWSASTSTAMVAHDVDVSNYQSFYLQMGQTSSNFAATLMTGGGENDNDGVGVHLLYGNPGGDTIYIDFKGIQMSASSGNMIGFQMAAVEHPL